MSNATERIKGYCTEVTQAQWEELVKMADEVGVDVSDLSRNKGTEYGMYPYAWFSTADDNIQTYTKLHRLNAIPFPDFLAKLRGEEWTPKAGEMVEVSDNNDDWYALEYIATRNQVHICWCNDESSYTRFYRYIRPLRPTITRAEAEQQLGKRIIDPS